jgi:hypothetical protein
VHSDRDTGSSIYIYISIVIYNTVRYGVAPDHLEVKNVTDTFAEVGILSPDARI